MKELFEQQQKAALRLRTEPIDKRKQRLKALNRWIHTNRQKLQEAVYADMRKPALEFDAIEVLYVLNEIKTAIRNLARWAAPRPVRATLDMVGTHSEVLYEPRGVCLIISPWNYPFSLCVGPLVSALAAGNTAILKPSELTPHTSAVIARMAAEIFDPAIVAVFEGDAEVSKQLLGLSFDHIFFTGSPAVGKLVMKAAAENLASVTLELGGKCPAIVTPSFNSTEAARRIAVSKFVNAGQTCVAPDYVLVHKSVEKQFLSEVVRLTQASFAADGSFAQSGHFVRIINRKHLDRLTALVDEAVGQGAEVLLGGDHNPDTCFFHPVIITHVSLTSRLMQEEIFGPVLPVVVYDTLEEAISIINDRPKPLGLYLFSNKREDKARVLQETSSGGVCINDCAVQFLHHRLPFGGVNGSGMGKSHGHAGFIAFSNEKPVLKQRNGFTSVKIFYPPYTNRAKSLMRWFMKIFYR